MVIEAYSSDSLLLIEGIINELTQRVKVLEHENSARNIRILRHEYDTPNEIDTGDVAWMLAG
jgi:hypothetical protein